MESMLNINNVSFGYTHNNKQVDSISITLNAGELTGIIGPNGAGKSTLLKIAAGIITPDCGSVTLGDIDIHSIDRKEVARKLGYLPQHINIIPGYSVEQVVAMGRFCHLKGFGFIGKYDSEIVEQAMVEAQVDKFRERYIECLSGGEQQRALLGSILAQQPEILLLDEPTTGLDLHHQSSFFTLLARQARLGKAVMTVTHDLNLAAKYCDKLILLNEGKLIVEGTPQEVITQEYISRIYHENILVTKHPVNGQPIVLV